MSSEPNIDDFPYREGFPVEEENEDAARRPVFFNSLPELTREALWNRGYVARTLIELPRGTKDEERKYLLAKAQAFEEGTIGFSKNDLEALKLEMQANKMLGPKAEDPHAQLKEKDQSVTEMLLAWGDSRHTLHGNTRMVSAEKGGKRAGDKQ